MKKTCSYLDTQEGSHLSRRHWGVSDASREAIMAVYPRHKMVLDKFVARGVVLGIGPFEDGGNMAIFKTREAAEAFSREDPLILEGLVKSFVIKDWDDSMLRE